MYCMQRRSAFSPYITPKNASTRMREPAGGRAGGRAGIFRCFGRCEASVGCYKGILLLASLDWLVSEYSTRESQDDST